MITRNVQQRRRRRSLACTVAIALLTASACSAERSTSSEPSSATAFDEDETGSSAEATAADARSTELTGIQVVPDIAGLTSIDSPVVLVEVQANRLLADLDLGAGVLGAAIDELVPLPPDIPPMSYLVAAWVSVGDTPAAVTARTWMGEQAWERAPEIRFPDAVVALFVNDVAAAVDAAAQPDDGSLQIDTSGLRLQIDEVSASEPAARGFAPVQRAARVVPSGPCSAVQQFLSSSLAAVVNALHVNPVQGGGLFAGIANVFVTVFNTAVQLAARAIAGLIEELTAPVFDIIRVGIATLGVATQFASFFRDTKLTITTQPTGPYRFAIGTESDIEGQLVARSDSLSGEWPTELVDCANATNVSLPTPIGAGADTMWTIRQPLPVISATSTTNQVGDDLIARLDFVTGRESDDDAKGTETNSAAFASARIPRKDVEDLLQLGRDQARAALTILLARIPIAPLRDLAAAALHAVVDPVLARVDQEISGAATGMFGLSGQHVVYVQFHIPPEPTTAPTTPPPTTSPPADFCAQLRELAQFAEFSDAPIVPWATEIVDRLERMKPSAPPDLVDDLDVLVRVYTAVAAEADILVLIDTTEPLPDASAALGAHCGINQSE
jgi:hypothetical protein